jgi:hypothetical protein
MNILWGIFDDLQRLQFPDLLQSITIQVHANLVGTKAPPVKESALLHPSTMACVALARSSTLVKEGLDWKTCTSSTKTVATIERGR